MFVNNHLIFIRTIAPLVLAQLLIQFQKPIDGQLSISTSSISNISNNNITHTRFVRNAYDIRDTINGEERYDHIKPFAPDYPASGT